MDWVAIVKNVCGLDWIGSEAQKIILEQLNCFIVLLSRSRLAIFALCILDNFMHGYLCVYYNFRVLHLFAELDMDWIG